MYSLNMPQNAPFDVYFFNFSTSQIPYMGDGFNHPTPFFYKFMDPPLPLFCFLKASRLQTYSVLSQFIQLHYCSIIVRYITKERFLFGL